MINARMIRAAHLGLALGACLTIIACEEPADVACGNGVLDTGEQCDDGNRSNGDNCTNACMFPVCGDGTVQRAAGEEYDGAGGDGGTCRPDCRFSFCGDGVLDPAKSAMMATRATTMREHLSARAAATGYFKSKPRR